MKRIRLFSAAALLMTAFSAPVGAAPDQQETNAPKVLIAYYSYSGNTKEVAAAIQKQTGGDLFEIKAEGTYPESYREMSRQVQQELRDGFRPRLTAVVDDISRYDVIFIGSPVWWGTVTPQVSSFLESHDLAGKTVIPFITHGGGGAANTIRDMTAICRGCKVQSDGWVGYGSRTTGLSGWLKGLKTSK